MGNTKIRYAVDPENRLKRFRHIIDGEFKINKNNSLTYTVKSPSHTAPQQLKISGNWSLDKNHNLVLTLDKENNQFAGKKITLKSEIIRANADKIEFLISAKDSNGQTHLYILALSGVWQADEHNRLKFMAQKKNGQPDELTLSGSWEVNKKNQLIYNYVKTGLKRGQKLKQELTFKGEWDISAKGRLKYSLNRQIGSGFDFTVSAGQPLNQGMLYELGITAKPAQKKITLFGKWKLNKKTGLLLEMPYEEGKIKAISFGMELTLAKGRQLELNLKNSFRQDLGLKLRLSQALTKNQGETFLQALREGRKITFQAGIGWRW